MTSYGLLHAFQWHFVAVNAVGEKYPAQLKVIVSVFILLHINLL